ncbi:MAG: prolipoprotein diacylglyceryl transferase, partial [Acidimicrobiaceae bacterium]|nr:prolipoprotein diacylglyceryl transferase [Acidimicrobiaceae bacterium]
AFIPSPPANGFSIGPVRIHVYGFLIAVGVVAAVWLAQRQWRRIGGADGVMTTLAFWAVPGGLIGARLYSVITSWQQDTGGHILRAFAIWQGGLGIWGGVAGGVALGYVGIRRARLPLAPVLDCVAPALLLAQAIGRWGNYFNQELYGRVSGLPWAVRIDHPDGAATAGTFQPTFLYESLWDLFGVGVVIWAERRFHIRRGYLFALYAAFYTAGRFWTEYLRIDPAHKYGPFRLNDWTAILVFAVAVILLATRGRWRPGLERAGDPLPAGTPGMAPAVDAPDGDAEHEVKGAEHQAAGTEARYGPT